MCKSNVSCICVVPIAIFTVILIMIIVIYFEVSWMEELNAAENGKTHQALRKKIKNKLYKLILNLESPQTEGYNQSQLSTNTITTKEPTTIHEKTTRIPPTTNKKTKASKKPKKTQTNRLHQHTPIRFKVSTTTEPIATEVVWKDPPGWLSLSSSVFNMWMHECREANESADEGEEITDVEANFPYDKYSLKLTYLSHPSLHPIAALVLVVKKILIGTFFLGVVFLIFIVTAFTKVKQTSGIGYITDRLSNMNSFQSLINHFRAASNAKADDDNSLLVLHSPTSSRSSVVSLSTVLEETSPLLLCQDELMEQVQAEEELRSVMATP